MERGLSTITFVDKWLLIFTNELDRWAWQNPHITLHIPPESRLQHAAGKKRSGHPKRPRHTVTSLLSNLHLLLRVPSFSRWPLEIRFFSGDVHKSWLKWCKTAREPIRSSIPIITDFPPVVVEDSEDNGSPKSKKPKATHGIAALDIEYLGAKQHVLKGKEIVEFEQEGACTVCQADLEHEAGIYSICPAPGCDSVTHLTCLSKHFLKNDESSIVPVQGNCPSCNTELMWVDVVKELTLRMRGRKEVEKLLKVKRARKGTTSSQAMVDSDDEDELSEEEMLEEARKFEAVNPWINEPALGDSWDAIPASGEDSDNSSVVSIAPIPKAKKQGEVAPYKSSQGVWKTVIEDSDWDDAVELD